MTQYIVTYEKINNRLETETWHDQRPSHRAVPEWVTDARAATRRAQAELDEFHETYGASTDWTSEQAAEFERLFNQRNAAIAWEYDCVELASHGEIPASIQYVVQMREDAR